MSSSFHIPIPFLRVCTVKLTHPLFHSLALSLVLSAFGCSDSDNVAFRENESSSDLRERSPQPGSTVDDERSTGSKIHPEEITLERPEAVSSSDDQGTSATRRVFFREAAATESQSDWPRWRGPHGTGKSNETGLIRKFPESGPEILWRAKLGTGFSGLTVSDGRVFTLFGAEGRERNVCFDANTGREIWNIDSDADFAQGRSFGPRATPYVEGEHVYIVGASGMLFCLKAATGEKVWSFNIYDKFRMKPHEEGLSCSPLVDGKKLIVLAGTSAFAFDKKNGELVWQALKEKMNHTTPKFAAIAGRKQLLVLTGQNLVGLDPESGRELWRHPQRAVNCATPVVGPHDQIFTAAAYGFGCQLIKLTDGTATQIYKNNSLATHHATAVLHEGHLYGFHDRPGIFKCVDFATGKEKWQSRSPGKGKLIIADGQMIVITEYGELVLAPVSPDGFRATAKARVVQGTCYTAPTLVNGKLYLRSDREMVCINIKE